MPRKAIQHGTRSGYKAGCRDRISCPGGESGTTCIDAANIYNRELREAHKQARARNPVTAGTRPSASGLRVRISSPRSEPRDAGNPGGTWPNPDMPVYDPPDSLVDAQVTADPEPAESQGDIYNDPDFVVTPKIRDDIRGKLGLYAAVIGIPFETIDPYCGGIFAQNCDSIIAKAIPLIVKSPGAVRFFTSTSGGWLDWIAFLQALWPVIVAIYAHHLARSVTRDNRPAPDPTMPPAPDTYEYSAA